MGSYSLKIEQPEGRARCWPDDFQLRRHTCRMQWPNDFCTSTCGNVCAFASLGNLAIPVHLQARLPYLHLWETLLCQHLSETLPPLHLWETLLRLHLKGSNATFASKETLPLYIFKLWCAFIFGKPCYVCIFAKPCQTCASLGKVAIFASVGNPATSASLGNLARPLRLQERSPYLHLWETLLYLRIFGKPCYTCASLGNTAS